MCKCWKKTSHSQIGDSICIVPRDTCTFNTSLSSYIPTKERLNHSLSAIIDLLLKKSAKNAMLLFYCNIIIHNVLQSTLGLLH